LVAWNAIKEGNQSNLEEILLDEEYKEVSFLSTLEAEKEDRYHPFTTFQRETEKYKNQLPLHSQTNSILTQNPPPQNTDASFKNEQNENLLQYYSYSSEATLPPPSLPYETGFTVKTHHSPLPITSSHQHTHSPHSKHSSPTLPTSSALSSELPPVPVPVPAPAPVPLSAHSYPLKAFPSSYSHSHSPTPPSTPSQKPPSTKKLLSSKVLKTYHQKYSHRKNGFQHKKRVKVKESLPPLNLQLNLKAILKEKEDLEFGSGMRVNTYGGGNSVGASSSEGEFSDHSLNSCQRECKSQRYCPISLWFQNRSLKQSDRECSADSVGSPAHLRLQQRLKKFRGSRLVGNTGRNSRLSNQTQQSLFHTEE
jgi:hypothetical protein